MTKRGFSLIEMLVVITIVGVLVFLAFPNVAAVKLASEDYLAISRAQALNAAKIAYKIRGVGSWDALTTDDSRYTALRPYLAYSPATFVAVSGVGYVPDGYVFGFGGIDDPVTVSNTVTGQPVGYD